MTQQQQKLPSQIKDLDMVEHPTDQSNGSTPNGFPNNSDPADGDQFRIKFADWGFKIDRLFEVAYRFYKRNESKAFHPSFDERNKMIALIMQARYGNHDGGRAPDIGVLDLVGKRRQYEWSLLNGMSKTEAMSKFICALDDLCPIFKAHAEAVKISSGIEQSFNTREPYISNDNSGNASQQSEIDAQMHNIYSSLCKQTYNQFKGYAEKQCPGDIEKQKHLITSLQEQYYQQYMSQMHPELKSSLPGSSQTSSGSISSLYTLQTSDNCNQIPESLSDNQTDDSIVPENQLTLVKSTPHLDLPLPAEQLHDSKQTDRTIDTVAESSRIDSSDIYCEENNIQTDISSEELVSGLEPIDSVSPVDEFDRTPEAKLTEELRSVSIAAEKPEVNELVHDMDEPVRLYQYSDLPPIGVFESFPEPKPIKNVNQRKNSVDQINPNSTPVLNELPQKPTIDHKYHSTLKNLSEHSSFQGNTLPSDAAASRGSMTPFEYSMTNHNNDKNNPNYHAGSDEFSSHTYQSNQETTTMQDQSCEKFKTSAMTESDDQIVTEVTRQQGPDLWDCLSSSGDQSPLQHIVAYEELEPATIWTKSGIAEFKESLGDDKQGGVYEVKESTLVIIQVPTYPDGKFVYWEFATDDFDIGFGLEFVYEKHLEQPMELKIYENIDEDDMDDMIEEDHWSLSAKSGENCSHPESGLSNSSTSGQMEASQRLLAEKRQRLANTISIVPTYRRDSHQEVFVGRHRYPGQGYYLLRFDNTYSVLRSKTLYFRICYFM